VSGIIGQRILVAAWGRLPAHLPRAMCGGLIVGGMLGGNAARLLERAPEEVALSTLPRALLTVTG
jgi:hypothetical protein